MIIGIAGKKGTGKTFLAEMLKDKINYKGDCARVYSLAKPIKEMVASLTGTVTGCSERVLYGRAFKSRPLPALNGYSPRRLAQHIGQAMRDLDEDFWIDMLNRKRMETPGCIAIVDDVRFDNEMEHITEQGGLIIHLEAPWLEGTDTHESENGITLTPVDNYLYACYSQDENARRKEAEDLVNKAMDIIYGTVE